MFNDTLVEDADPRWGWLSTITALIVLTTFVAYVGLALTGTATVGALTQGWFVLYGTTVLGAIAYVFGRETLKTIYQFRNGGFDKKK